MSTHFLLFCCCGLCLATYDYFDVACRYVLRTALAYGNARCTCNYCDSAQTRCTLLYPCFLDTCVLAPLDECRQTRLNKVHRTPRHDRQWPATSKCRFILMSICGSSSKAGFGRRPVRPIPFSGGAWCPGSVLTVSTCFQIQRKVVVCGDGACGMYPMMSHSSSC